MEFELRSRRTTGFTLIELLIVMVIIAVLIAIVVPAINKAVQGVERGQCQNKLKNLMMAMNLYHDQYQMYPINYGILDTLESQVIHPDIWQGTWMQGILPFIDEKDLYSTINYNWPLIPVNTTVALTKMDVFLCPSDTGDGYVNQPPGFVEWRWAATNYKTVAGMNWKWSFYPGPRDIGNWGALLDASTWPLRGADRGRYNYLEIYVERARRDRRPTRWGYGDGFDGRDFGNGFLCRGGLGAVTTRKEDIKDSLTSTITIGESVTDWCDRSWWFWFDCTTATAAIPINDVLRRFPRVPDRVLQRSNWMDNSSFMSQHPGGANFAFADGHVKFISEDINIIHYHALATIDVNDIPGDY